MPTAIGIFVTGASSTGKTTLCEALKRRLEESGMRVFHVAEVARTVMREQGFTRDHVDTLEMQEAIMIAQISAETKTLESIRNATRSSSPSTKPFILLCDRCAIDPVVYATMHLDSTLVSSLTRNPLFRMALARYSNAQRTTLLDDDGVNSQPIVVLLDGVEDWKSTDDGIRSLYDPWKVTVVFRRVLQDLGVWYHELGENIKAIDRRVDWVIDVAGLRRYLE